MGLQRILPILAIIFAFYLVYIVLMFALQRPMMYPGAGFRRGSHDLPDLTGIDQIWLKVDHYKVEAWYIPPISKPSSGKNPVLIFTHGNGEVIDYWPANLRGFNKLGFGVLLVEYPGFGRSKGNPSMKSITQTMIAAYDVITERSDIDSSKVVLMGRSLGGGAACLLAKHRPVAAMILTSTFASIADMARRLLIPTFLILDPYDNTAIVSDFKKPLLIFHGEMDQVVPYRHGVILSSAAPHSRFITYPDDHNLPRDWGRFWVDVEHFLKEEGII